jgi:hypothetical protein
MLCARKSGRIVIDGREHEILAGATQWSSDLPELADPEVAAFFRRSNGRAAAVERGRAASATKKPAAPELPPWALTTAQAARKPSWMLPMPPEHVEVRHRSPANVTISFGSGPWGVLSSCAGESRDGRETAGFLFGDHVWSFHREVSVRRVTRMVTKRFPTSAELDITALAYEKAGLKRAGVAGQVGEIGNWHTHPNSTDGRPSERDLAAWLNGRDFSTGRSMSA